MTTERARLLERAQAVVHRSAALIHAANRASASATVIRHVTAQQRRKSFVLYIGGGAETDDAPEQAVKKKLAQGVLPWRPATKVEYSRGWGETKTCVACDRAIGPHHVKVDADFDLVLAGPGVRLPFHSACFAAWQKEMGTSLA